MFKKSFKVATHNVLSGKDRKKMRQVLSAKFDPASVDILLGKSDIEIFCDKLAGSKTYIYTWNDIPILVDENGKGNYFPTGWFYSFLGYKVNNNNNSLRNPNVSQFGSMLDTQRRR